MKSMLWARSLFAAVVGVTSAWAVGCGSDGVVGGGCADGYTDCNGVCLDLGHDPLDCGACGLVCSPGLACSAGTCVVPGSAGGGGGAAGHGGASGQGGASGASGHGGAAGSSGQGGAGHGGTSGSGGQAGSAGHGGSAGTSAGGAGAGGSAGSAGASGAGGATGGTGGAAGGAGGIGGAAGGMAGAAGTAGSTGMGGSAGAAGASGGPGVGGMSGSSGQGGAAGEAGAGGMSGSSGQAGAGGDMGGSAGAGTGGLAGAGGDSGGAAGQAGASGAAGGAAGGATGGAAGSAGAGGAGCLPPTIECSGVCVDPTDDPTNCGGCDIVCPTFVCQSMKCVGSLDGHQVLIGMDFANVPANKVDSRRVLANASFLNGPRPDGSWHIMGFNPSASPTVAKVDAVITASAPAHGITSLSITHVTTTADVAAQLTKADFDVVLVYDQPTAPAGSLGDDGTALAVSFTSFTKQGGDILVLSGGTGTNEMWSFVANAQIMATTAFQQIPIPVPLAGPALVNNNQANSVGIGVSSVFAASPDTGFWTIVLDPSIADIIDVSANGKPVVLHRTVAP